MVRPVRDGPQPVSETPATDKNMGPIKRRTENLSAKQTFAFLREDGALSSPAEAARGGRRAAEPADLKPKPTLDGRAAVRVGRTRPRLRGAAREGGVGVALERLVDLDSRARRSVSLTGKCVRRAPPGPVPCDYPSLHSSTTGAHLSVLCRVSIVGLWSLHRTTDPRGVQPGGPRPKVLPRPPDKATLQNQGEPCLHGTNPSGGGRVGLGFRRERGRGRSDWGPGDGFRWGRGISVWDRLSVGRGEGGPTPGDNCGPGVGDTNVGVVWVKG